MRRAAVLLAGVALAAGCGGGDDARPEPSDEQVIRGWIRALNAGDFERAGGYFAQGALVQQADVFRLDTKAEAIAFNRGLPCRADVTDIEKERDTTLAAFRLREGRGGRCAEGGSARVRFLIRNGRIAVWSQLPEPAGPSGPVASTSRPRTI
jgi:hypothetical protein